MIFILKTDYIKFWITVKTDYLFLSSHTRKRGEREEYKLLFKFLRSFFNIYIAGMKIKEYDLSTKKLVRFIKHDIIGRFTRVDSISQ